eukprot:1149604-Pelagomonas_calceolata.AAC.6
MACRHGAVWYPRAANTDCTGNSGIASVPFKVLAGVAAGCMLFAPLSLLMCGNSDPTNFFLDYQCHTLNKSSETLIIYFVFVLNAGA